MRVVAIRTGNFSFPQRHVGRTLQLRFSLQVALEANFRLGLLGEKNGLVLDLRELILRARLLHNRMAVNARDAAACVRARLPIGLDAALMALEAGFVLHLDRRRGIFAECDESADPLSSPSRHVIAARTMT